MKRRANEHYEFLKIIYEREYNVKRLAETLEHRENESEEKLPESLQKLSDAMVQFNVAIIQAELSEEEIKKQKKEAERKNYAAKNG